MHAFTHQNECGVRPSRPLVCVLDLIGIGIATLFLVYRPEPSVLLLPVVVLAQYAASCMYHWRPKNKVVQAIDNLMIPVLITGTYVQYWLGSLPAPDATWRSALLGSVTGLIIAIRLLRSEHEILKCVLYLLLGAGGLGLSILSSHHLPEVAWYGFLVGVGLYFVQFLVYAFQRPDPFPALIGYREIQHLVLVAASALHLYIAALYL